MEKAGPATTMLGEASKYIQDTSVLRRLMFATSVLPEDTPKLWEIITKFAGYKAASSTQLLPQQAKLIADNISFTDKHVLTSDESLFRELVLMPFERREHVGVVLISTRQSCIECGGKLCYGQTTQVMSPFTPTHMVPFQPFIIESSVLTVDVVVTCSIMGITQKGLLYITLTKTG